MRNIRVAENPSVWGINLKPEIILRQRLIPRGVIILRLAEHPKYEMIQIKQTLPLCHDIISGGNLPWWTCRNGGQDASLAVSLSLSLRRHLMSTINPWAIIFCSIWRAKGLQLLFISQRKKGKVVLRLKETGVCVFFCQPLSCRPLPALVIEPLFPMRNPLPVTPTRILQLILMFF